MNTNCTDARGELPLYVGGDLEPASQERVERHLEHCAPCRSALEETRVSRELLREHFASPEIELHRPEIWSGVRAGLLEQGLIRARTGEVGVAGSPSTAPGAKSRGRLLRLVPVAAAAAALFFLGTFAGRRGLGGGPTDPVATEPGPSADAVVTRDQGPGPELLSPVAPVAEGTLSPLREGDSPMQYVARPWLGEVLPLGVYPGHDTSAAGFSQAPNYRADGVR